MRMIKKSMAIILSMLLLCYLVMPNTVAGYPFMSEVFAEQGELPMEEGQPTPTEQPAIDTTGEAVTTPSPEKPAEAETPAETERPPELETESDQEEPEKPPELETEIGQEEPEEPEKPPELETEIGQEEPDEPEKPPELKPAIAREELAELNKIDGNDGYEELPYSLQNAYSLEFFNYSATDKTYSIEYGTSIEDMAYTPEYPPELDPSWIFKGWYETWECSPESRFNWDNATMPDHDLIIYALWVPADADDEGGLLVEKTANKWLATVGEVIKYTVTITNTDTKEITDVVAVDPFMSDEWRIGTLKPDEARTRTYPYTVTDADLITGYVYNRVTVTGTNEGGDTEAGEADLFITVVSEKPKLTIMIWSQVLTYGTVVSDAARKNWAISVVELPMTLTYGQDYTIRIDEGEGDGSDLSAGNHYNCLIFEPTDDLLYMLSDYELNLVPGSLIVNTRPIQLFPFSVEMMYNGQPHGFRTTVLPESPLVSYTPSMMASGHYIYSATAGNDSIVNVGVYPNEIELTDIVIHDAHGNDVTANYSQIKARGNLTITQQPVNLIVHDAEIVYGDAEPEYNASYAIVPITEKLNFTISREPGGDAGTYAVNAILGNNPNHKITVSPGTLTINPRAITLTVDDASKAFGDTDPRFTAQITEGALVGEDELNYTYTRVQGDSVGTYEISIDLGDNPNYDITVVTGTLTIEMSIMIEKQTITYGTVLTDELKSSWSLITSDLPDGISLEYFRDYTIRIGEGQGDGSDLSAGEHLDCLIFEPTEYLLDLLSGHKVNIMPGSLTVNNKVAQVVPFNRTKVYDGEPLGFITTVLPEQPWLGVATLVNGHYIYSATTGNDKISVAGGYYNQISMKNIIIHDAQGNDVTANYTLYPNTATLTITKQPVTLTVRDVEITYGDPEPTYEADVEFSTKQGVSLIYTLACEADVNAGTYQITANLGDNSNYEITVINGTLTINRKGNGGKEPGEGETGDFYGIITIDPQTKMHGETDPPNTYTCNFEGLEYDDELSFSLVREPGEDTGSYKITIQWADTFPTQNYDLSAVKIEGNYLTIDGFLEWGVLDSGMNGMNLHFGGHRLPIGAVNYPSTDTSHTLRIKDNRIQTDGWCILVGMSMFEGDDGSAFKGRITLTDPTNESHITSVTYPLSVVSDGGNIPVMTASDDLGNGVFDITWSGDNVVLHIDDEEYVKVNPVSYQAQMTWTIIDAP